MKKKKDNIRSAVKNKWTARLFMWVPLTSVSACLPYNLLNCPFLWKYSQCFFTFSTKFKFYSYFVYKTATSLFLVREKVLARVHIIFSLSGNSYNVIHFCHMSNSLKAHFMVSASCFSILTYALCLFVTARLPFLLWSYLRNY